MTTTLDETALKNDLFVIRGYFELALRSLSLAEDSLRSAASRADDLKDVLRCTTQAAELAEKNLDLLLGMAARERVR